MKHKFTKKQRKELNKKAMYGELIELELDITNPLTNQQIADELGIHVNTLYNWRKTDMYKELKERAMTAIVDMPTVESVRDAISDLVPETRDVLHDLLVHPDTPASVRLQTVKYIHELSGISGDASQENKKEMFEFFKKRGINIEQLNVHVESPIPDEYQNALEEVQPIEAEFHTLPVEKDTQLESDS